MKKITAKRLLALVMVLAMVLALFPVTGASATEEAQAESATVKIGAEVLLESEYWQEYLAGKNVALFTNQVCVDAQMNHLADKLAASESINLVCLFGGEHGLRGSYQAGAAVPHCIDATTGLINWSLYSGGSIDTEALGIAALDEGMENPASPNRPTRAMLTGNNGKWYEPVDVILFDLQEIGSKTWTYLYNLADLMAACVESAKYYGKEVELIVLDRPSSIGSDTVEGTMHTSNNQVGFARFPLPSRYGLTMGEVALMYQGEGWKYFWQTTYPGGPANLYGSATSMPSGTYGGVWAWDHENFKDKLSLAECPVTVIPCEGYTRDMYWDETGLQFILPSPNMPTAEACLIYAGTVWFEGLPINEGRGTTKPFEAISAPYIDGEALADRLNELGLEGVIFRPYSTTTLSANQLLSGTDYVNLLSHGVQIHITDKRAFSPIEMQVALSLTLQAMYGPTEDSHKTDGDHFYAHYQLDYRSGSDWVSSTINAFPVGSTTEDVLAKTAEMLARMDEETADYKVMREKYLLEDYNTPEDKELVTTAQPAIVPGYAAFLENAADYAGKRIGLYTNQTGVDLELNHLADVFAADENVNLTTLFSTGFGVRGEYQYAGAGTYTDSQTGLSVYRLNGTAPTAEALATVDVLVFDIQDTGSRYNGVAETLDELITACAAANVQLVVLDRPNPLGGMKVDGPVDDTYGLPTQHGMTTGELALYLASEEELPYVTVSMMEGWTRAMLYADTGLQFIQSDRMIPTSTTLLTYASLGWLEGCATWSKYASSQSGVSYGWGTTKTFEFFGAPFMKEEMVAFAEALNELNLPGVRFRLAAMTPWNNTTKNAGIMYAGTACYGVQLHIMDADAYSPVDTIIGILTTMYQYFPEEVGSMFTKDFDKITGSDTLAADILNGRSMPEIISSFQDDLSNFKSARSEVLLYSDHDHVWDEGVVTEATCTEGGYTTYTCAICEDTYESDYTDALGHEWENGSCVRCGTLQEIPFTDVPVESYYYAPVMWAVEEGITTGTSESTFSPEDSCQRAAVVTFLWRAAGSPEPTTTEHPFTDVKESAFYYDAMLWAYENGITTGMTATEFGPYENCNRGQVVTFLWRALKQPAATTTEHPFTDVKAGAFYYDAMLWAVENNVTTGMTTTTFEPGRTCNRAQIVTFLYRAYN